MAVDIGPRIGIDGEAEFRKQINNINQSIKTLGSEMKAVTSEFAGQEKSVESLTAENKVLTKTITDQEKKLELLKKGLEESQKAYGENDTKTLRWKQAVNEATAALNKSKTQIKQNEDAMERLADDVDDTADAFDKAGGKGINFGDILNANVFSSIATGLAEKLVSTMAEAVKQFLELDKATEDLRIAMGKLNTAFEAAGYDTETANEAYKGFYKILGDTDTAVEASQLLARLSTNAQDMAKWIDVAAGVSGTFGDALPIESLVEAANETAKVGEVTGVLADALNWAGINEDEFNEKLQAATTEAERNDIILTTLTDTYDDASKAFYENNKQIIKNRENQVELEGSLGDLGDTIGAVKAQMTDELTPAVVDFNKALAGTMSGAEGADKALDEALKNMGVALSDQIPTAAGVSLKAIGAGKVAFDNAKKELFITPIKEMLADVEFWFGESFLLGWQKMTEAFSGAGEWASGVWENIKAPFAGASSWFGSNFDLGWQKIKEAFSNAGEWASGVWENIKAPFTGASSWFGSNFDLGWAKIKEAFSNAGEWAKGIWEKIKKPFANAWEDFKSVGSNIVSGVWQGIQSAIGWFTTKVKNFFTGIVNSVKQSLGIRSPSRVFAEIGKFMALGLDVGFARGIRNTQRDIDKSISDLIPDVVTTGQLKYNQLVSGGRPDVDYIIEAFKTALASVGVYIDRRKIGNVIFAQQNNETMAHGVSPTLA